MRPQLAIWLVLVAGMSILGCGAETDTPPMGEEGTQPSDGPHDPDAEMRPDLMVADPPALSPGAVVELTFPESSERGVFFVLERQQGGSWEYAYSMLSDRHHQAETVPADAEIGYDDIGIAGAGPDHVHIPEDAEPGTYRICTGNARENFCTPIEIVGD